MKKLFKNSVLALSFILILSACGNNKAGTDNIKIAELENKIAELTEENERLKNNAKNENQKSTPENKKDNENTDMVAKGSRKNPFKIGETAIIQGQYLNTPIKIKLTLKNLHRGEEAKKLALKDNQFNKFDKGEETLLLDVDFELLEYNPADDKHFLISHSDFSYYKNDYTQYSSNNFVTINNELFAKIYAGGKTTGRLGLIIPENDNGYLLYSDYIWFKIGE